MKFKDALRRFLGGYSNPRTIDAYEQSLLLFQRYVGEERDVGKINEIDMIDWLADIRTSYRYSESSIWRHIKTVKIFFNWCVRMKILTTSPASVLKNPRPKRDVGRNKAITDEEVAAILPYAYPNPMYYALVLFFLDTGCRTGGAASVLVADLNIPRREARVTEKGNKSRPVWFEEKCADALRRYLEIRPDIVSTYIERCAARGEKVEDHGFLFCHIDGPYTGDALSQIIYRLGLDAKLTRPIGAHMFRHRKGYQLADAKVAPSVAATALGHSDPMITLQYYYPADYGRAEEAIRQLGFSDSPKPQIQEKIVRFK